MKLFGRYVLLGFGLLFMGFGIALITQSQLGTSPISTLPLVASYITTLSFGLLTFGSSILFMMVQLIVRKKLFHVTLIAQLIVGVLFGFFVDFGMFVFSFVHVTSILAHLIALIIGCMMLSMGIYLQVVADVVMNAGEATVKLISDKYERDFGTVKILFDWTLVAMACLLSFIFLHTIKGIGFGTLISSFLVGYLIKVIVIIKDSVKRRIVFSKDQRSLPGKTGLGFIQQKKA